MLFQGMHTLTNYGFLGHKKVIYIQDYGTVTGPNLDLLCIRQSYRQSYTSLYFDAKTKGIEHRGW